MLRPLLAFCTLAAAAAIAAPALAAVAFYSMETSGSTWTLRAGVIGPDNFGIAGYAFPLGGGITSIEHKTPATAFASGPGGASGPAGFTAVRTTMNSYVAAGQNTFDPTQILIRGFGQTPGSYSDIGIIPFGPTVGDTSWSFPAVIATGTWADTLPTVIHNIDLGVNVFTEATGTDTEAANIGFVDPSLPSVALNALGQRDRAAGVISAPFLAIAGDPPIIWSNLLQTFGPPAAIPAAIQGGNMFSWDPAGSLASSKGSGNVKYQWIATATNALGADTDVAIEVILIPEPAALCLFGLAMIALVGAFRRRG